MNASHKTRIASTPNGILDPGQRPSTKGFQKPRRKWDDVCKFCRGTGKVCGLRGWEDCQGCSADEETIDQIIAEWKEAEGGMAP